MFSSKKFEGKYKKWKKKREKVKIKENKNKNLKIINYFYILF